MKKGIRFFKALMKFRDTNVPIKKMILMISKNRFYFSKILNYWTGMTVADFK